MPDLKVVQLRAEAPLTDIPGQLRGLADRIAGGQQPAEYLLVVIDDPTENWPIMFSWGAAMNTLSHIGMLEIAKTWFINEITKDD